MKNSKYGGFKVMKYFFIVNPASRSGRGKEVWLDIRRTLDGRKIPFQVFFTQYEGHGTRLVRQIAGQLPGCRLVVVGGDGTLNEVLSGDTDCCIALETMAGKGSEIGRSFEELAKIYDGVTHSEKLRVCFDTCHTSDSGYDIIHHFDDVIDEFDRIIGKDQIAVFHINDSKNPPGAAKDRHENIGFGHIGFDAINYIIRHPDFENVPKILETPYIPSQINPKKSYAPYKYEIEMLRRGIFDPDLKEKILKDSEQ